MYISFWKEIKSYLRTKGLLSKSNGCRYSLRCSFNSDFIRDFEREYFSLLIVR
jgi:hypothetical protein